MKKIPREDLLGELQRLAAVLGHPPTTTEMDEHGQYSAVTYHSRFGSWNEALSAVGFEPSRKRRVTDDELRDDLNRLAEKLGRAPTSAEVDEEGTYHSQTYRDRFGSWDEVLDEVGMETTGSGYIPDEALIDEINRLYETYDRAPTTTEMRQDGQYSLPTYLKRFDSWDGALNEAEIPLPDRSVDD
ncbi:homing endonuclease associated repeat-containing protein [Natrialba sp. SSL1]|uniref:homing endonuclease associated repeat-containing protein n=1 Tax=Natrialba sp. SSL1 TaxID=1869245 RepID=UPI001113664B|nr:hypothetical protein [Natrialba sp. SSL1]